MSQMQSTASAACADTDSVIDESVARAGVEAGVGIQAMVHVSEAIKEVVNHSRKLYLTSLNAMFSARRAGSRAVGFSTVTTELRTFSRRVSDYMDGVAARIDRGVYQVSEMQKQRRLHDIALAAVAATGGAERAGLIGFELRIEQRMAAHEMTVAETRRLLREQLRAALRLCRIGENLAVQAKVEATSADTPLVARELAGVAEEVARNVASIEQVIGAQYRYLKD